MSENILKIQNLGISVDNEGSEKAIVEHVNLEVPSLSIVALVGASGSGKSTTGLAVLRLLSPALRVKEGDIFFLEQNIYRMKTKELQQMRGGNIGMIFQEPLNAFNPVFSIGYQIEEVLTYHTKLDAKKRRDRAFELLDIVGMSDPKRAYDSYPHQLSGGMRQRAMIAQAISGNPKLLIADEPTSNLDVTLQAKIMDLFIELRDKLQLSILLITHDLGMVRHISDYIAVMTKGHIIEKGKTQEVLNNPHRDYTNSLLKALQF